MAEQSCRPGDYTLTQIPEGFLIGLCVEREGAEPWYDYVTLVRSGREDAVAKVRALAQAAGVRAWHFTEGVGFELIWGLPAG